MRARLTVPAYLLLTLLPVACGRGAPVPPTPEPAASGRAPALPDVELPVSRAFLAAVERGTRTLEGVPGPEYWQQRADYRIEAELDPEAKVVRGDQTVVYHNRSPDVLPVLVLNAYQNIHRAGAARVVETSVTDGLVVERVNVDGAEVPPAEQAQGTAAYFERGTLILVRLPRALQPGDSVRLGVAWHYEVAPGANRTGYSSDVFQIAQWYPQIAVYDDIRGWDVSGYLGQGEFYLEYGDFDVAITVPEGWIVAATGVLENADEVLDERVASRLAAAAAADTVVHVITQDDLDAGPTVREPGGRLTWRFRARNVRDVAFAASPAYLWDAMSVALPDADGDGAPERTSVHALYTPDARAWREAVEMVRQSLGYHARHWGPYPYPQMTAAEGPVGGMEYPMLTFVGAYAMPQQLYMTINHEVAHEWFPMLVGSNEAAYAWMDEGFATYIENQSIRERYPAYAAYRTETGGYLNLAGSDEERPLMREADLYPAYESYAIAAYFKPAVALRALETVIGADVVHAALREYYRRWIYRHPTPWDFFNTVEAVAGRDLDWFWRPWWFGTDVLDQAIVGVTTTAAAGGERVVIEVAHEGGLTLPALLRLTTESDDTVHVEVPVEAWLDGTRVQRVEVAAPGRVTRIELDPERRLPDVDRLDNVWRRPDAATRP